MTTRLQLAAALLTATAALTHAQVQTEAPTQIHTPTINPHHRARPEDLSWLWQYTQPAPGSRENQMLWDTHFKPFLQKNLTAPQSFWKAPRRPAKPLADIAMEFLGMPGQVIGHDNRYFNADGCLPHFCPDRGLLWVDTGLSQPLVIFSAVDWISDNRGTDEKGSAYTLWVFPNRALNPTQLPPAFSRSIARWTAQPSSGATDLQNITRVYLVDPDGTPHTLAPTTIGAHNTLPAETSDEQKAQP